MDPKRLSSLVKIKLTGFIKLKMVVFIVVSLIFLKMSGSEIGFSAN